MLRKGGTHLIIGYGGTLEIPTVRMIFGELTVAGSLVGNYKELVELIDLVARGKVACLRSATRSKRSTGRSTISSTDGISGGR
jgi:NAD+-dependent secondary alcohol dehydrogenase Adh1